MRVPVTLVDEIVHSVVSENGNHLVLTLAEADADRITLGIPCDQLPALIDLSARALADSERVLRRGWDPRTRVKATWWNLSCDDAPENLLLSLTFRSGGTLSFTLPGHMAAALWDGLTAHLQAASQEERGFGRRLAVGDS